MGSGKSSVGKELSEIYKSSFVDLDDEIVKVEKKSIDKLFSENGELYFRKLEYECLKKILKLPEFTIFSLGGGTPCYFDTAEMLSNNNFIETVFLRTSINILTKRLFKETNDRPKIKHINSKEELQKKIGKDLFERNYFYNKSKHTIDTDNKSVFEVANEIKLSLKKHLPFLENPTRL